MKKCTANFTRDEAEKFVKKILEDVIPHGKVDKLDEYYLSDVIGHYGDDELFSFKDIEQRVQAIKTNTKKTNFIVHNVVLIDDLILFTCRQNWINKIDDKFFEQMVYGVYRIKNKKISELWIVLNAVTAAYKEINKNFGTLMQPFEENEKSKREFFDKIAVFQKNETDKNLRLSKQ